MSTAAQLVYEKALLLTDEERKQVVKDLLDTFEYDDFDFEIDDDLSNELKSRLDDMQSGKETGIPWEEARREIFKD